MNSEAIDTGTPMLRVETIGRVGVITMNRPERRNAVHDEMMGPFNAIVEQFAADPAVGCIVVTGAGSAFCAGGDVRDGSGRRADGERPDMAERVAGLIDFGRIIQTLREASILSIAAVNGPAVGAGMAIALACDLRIAAESARFAGAWGKWAFTGDFGGPWLLTHQVGRAKALELLASNETIGADEALRIGLVNRVSPAEGFAEAWLAWANVFANASKSAIAGMKANVLDAFMPLADAMPLEAARMIASFETPDHTEAVRAYVQKREPKFNG